MWATRSRTWASTATRRFSARTPSTTHCSMANVSQKYGYYSVASARSLVFSNFVTTPPFSFFGFSELFIEIVLHHLFTIEYSRFDSCSVIPRLGLICHALIGIEIVIVGLVVDLWTSRHWRANAAQIVGVSGW